MQHLIDLFSSAYTTLRQPISFDKTTVIIYQPGPGEEYAEPSVYVYGQILRFADRFLYLGSALNPSSTLDDEVSLLIVRLSTSFGKLNGWS